MQQEPADNQFSALRESQAYVDTINALGHTSPIYDDCLTVSPLVKVCATITIDKACIRLLLANAKVAEGCASWNISGSKLQATLQFPTVNVGIWKLENPTFEIEHDLQTGDGGIFFSAKLLEFGCKIPGTCKFFEKQVWQRHVVVRW